MTKLRPPIKTHGGKYYLANWIIESFPLGYEQMVYLEPFCGGASVFLNKKASLEECLNDLDVGIIQILRALRDEPGEFIRRLKLLKYSEATFDRMKKLSENEDEFDDYIEHAVVEFVLRRMSRGGLKKHFGWSTRIRGGQPGDLNAWQTILEDLPNMNNRLQHVYIMNYPAITVIKAFDTENTFFYLDPPYLASTRTSTNTYEYEMNDDDHIALLNTIQNLKGKVLISGYSSRLYNRMLKGWKCKRKRIVNHSSQAKTKQTRTECLWCNY